MTIEFIDFHKTSLSTSKHIRSFDILEIDLAMDAKNPFFIGPHPWKVSEYNMEDVKKSILLAKKSAYFFGLGEVGLDKSYDENYLEQKLWFKSFLDFAHQEKIQFILLHCVKAYAEVIENIKLYPKLTFIFHDFNTNLEILNQLIKLNCYFSVGPTLMKNNSQINQIIKNIPINRMFFETGDSGYSIEEIYLKASTLIDLSIEELSEKIKINYSSLSVK